MHCNICNKMLSDKEVVYNEELGTYEPCVTCLEIAMEAAYSGSFARNEEEEYEIEAVLESDFDEFEDFTDVDTIPYHQDNYATEE